MGFGESVDYGFHNLDEVDVSFDDGDDLTDRYAGSTTDGVVDRDIDFETFQSQKGSKLRDALASRTASSATSSIPTWVPWAIGAVVLGGLAWTYR